MDLAVLANHVEQAAFQAAGLVPPPALAYSSPSPPPTILSGPMTFHQLNIQGSAVGVLNTGEKANLRDIDVSLAMVSEAGAEEVATALQRVTEAVIEAEDDLNPGERAAVLDQLKELAAQASRPEEERSRGVVRALVSGLGSTLQAAGGLAGVWDTWGPALRRFFLGAG